MRGNEPPEQGDLDVDAVLVTIPMRGNEVTGGGTLASRAEQAGYDPHEG